MGNLNLSRSQALLTFSASIKRTSMAAENTNRLRESFIALAESLLESIQEVFPECDETGTARRLFGAIIHGDSNAEDKFLRRCMDEIRSRQERIKEHDVEALFEIADGLSLLKTIDLRSKWSDPEFSDESKAHLWQYIEALQTYGGLYCAVPSAVMAKIEQAALSVSETMTDGQFDLSKVDLAALGKDLIAGLSSEEVEEFEGSLTDVYSCVGNVASLLSKQTGNESFDVSAMMSCVQNLQGNVVDGSMDVSGVLQQLSGVIGGGGSGAQNPLMAQALASFANQATTITTTAGALEDAPSSKRRKKKASSSKA